MAEVVQEKSRGLKFAEQQLLRHGWEHGKGLGRAENGISEAIKVKVKCNKGGVGHKEGEQFTFHWWDHVFNKASSSLQVESDQNGIKLKKTVEEDEEEGMISNKKPRKAALDKAKLYGRFVKSATLLSGQEQPEPKASNSEDSSSSDDEEDQRLDLSSTIKLSDKDLMKACGGRTAHKGARHGLTMSAKLARLEQQEAEFMAKYGKKKQPANSSPSAGIALTPPTSQLEEKQEETAEEPQRKKTKKKKSAESTNDINCDEASENPKTDMILKKKKKKSSKKTEEITDAVSTDGDVISVENCEAEDSHKTKRQHKKKKTNREQKEEEQSSPRAESPEETTELHTDTKVKKKKKKKSFKHQSEPTEEENNDTESSQSGPIQDSLTEKNIHTVTLEEAEVTEEESTVRQKRKKCEKDITFIEYHVNEEALPPKKKKKKKSRE
ncbi:G patch domain-containing protein 4 [Cheilinus undulatus]|uniref:G patch domain-containing protein 4 n=1 Tax=Cheilinus undulatus TaxID=241271 RepID=UPI001BD53082|nr:G patch domain-containing protein 4 [Cheilinus undulatus]